MKTIIALFARRKPIFGSAIFQQQSWLSKQVNEAIWKRNFYLD
jgi:hypothetical protein